MPISNFAHAALIFVGGVFLITGIAKMLEPWKFTKHLAQQGIVPKQVVLPTAYTFIAFESALGIALILAVVPSVLIPLSIALLLGLGVLNYWSTMTGRTQDCGCYNGWLELTPIQSLLLNIGYVVLLIFAGLYGEYEQPTVLWQWMATVATLVTSGALASGSMTYLQTHLRPYIDSSPLKVNIPWESEWLGSKISLNQGIKLIAFIKPKCPECQRLLPVLKVIHFRSDLPEVVGVTPLTTMEEVQGLAGSYRLNFPLVAIQHTQFQQLASINPTVVVVVNGTIREKWILEMPQPFKQRIRQGDLTVPDGNPQVLISAGVV